MGRYDILKEQENTINVLNGRVQVQLNTVEQQVYKIRDLTNDLAVKEKTIVSLLADRNKVIVVNKKQNIAIDGLVIQRDQARHEVSQITIEVEGYRKVFGEMNDENRKLRTQIKDLRTFAENLMNSSKEAEMTAKNHFEYNSSGEAVVHLNGVVVTVEKENEK